jgi:hypothetical protein
MNKPTKTSGSVSDRAARETINYFVREMRKLITSKNEAIVQCENNISALQLTTQEGLVINLSVMQKEA